MDQSEEAIINTGAAWSIKTRITLRETERKGEGKSAKDSVKC